MCALRLRQWWSEERRLVICWFARKMQYIVASCFRSINAAYCYAIPVNYVGKNCCMAKLHGVGFNRTIVLIMAQEVLTSKQVVAHKINNTLFMWRSNFLIGMIHTRQFLEQ